MQAHEQGDDVRTNRITPDNPETIAGPRGRARALRVTGTTRAGIVGLVACLIGLLVSTAPLRADAATTVTVTWTTQEQTLADGRTYWVRGPSCEPADAPECVAFLGKPRGVVLWFHGAFAREDPDYVRTSLAVLRSWSRPVIFVYAISANGSRLWDAGMCCTATPVDDLGYLERVVDDVAARWTVDRARVGAVGMSNGGMLAEQAACQRPDLVAAAGSLGGSFDGACDVGFTQVAQWHGADDPVAPLDGGYIWFNGARRTIPPAAALAQRMANGSIFELRVRPGYGHELPWEDMQEAVLWVVAHLPA